MEFFKSNTHINFMGLRKWAAAFSAVVVLASVISLFVNGLNWGLEFTGGTEVHLSFQQPANLTEIRADLDRADFDINNMVVQNYGTSNSVLVRIGGGQN
ncbi:MAG: protein translocase subunit SecF, partial [Gammaproteobacteria bacterium]